MDEAYVRDRYRSHESSRYRDYIRLHSGPRKIIFLEQEQELLKTGIVEFGLSLEAAKDGLYGATHELEIALESQVEKHLRTFLITPRTAREERLAVRGQAPKTLNRQRFEEAVNLYQTLTRATLTRDEARKRVKRMVQCLGLKARRDWLRLGSRKWFNGIQTAAV